MINNATEGPAKQALLKPKAIAITFGSQYHLGEKLGEGAFSVVRKCVHIGSGTAYAAKCLDLRNISLQDLHNIEREVKILQQLHHPNVISCKDYFLESTTGYIVTDLMEGGDLFDRIVEKSVYTEREAKDVVHAVVDAVAYCHAKRIVHRDLKPENILLSSHDDCTAVIKVADFGLAKDESYLTTMCGSPAYVAPEVLSGDRGLYNKAVDVWSVGVITFALLSGYLPFFDDNPSQMFKKIKHGVFSFESPYWDDISPCAKAFVKAALVVDPSKRATAEDLLRHSWMQTANDATVPLSSALSGLRTLSKRTSLKTAAKAVLQLRRLSPT
ncbi:CAMK protein kinase [Aphanomyces astaci]|uniref:CAMK protein kinase n=1 Tax=Aphanomyces astaci TaxID=112090 RepID=W4FDL8_APHAT|nr:CAMK protein kinase [Aphanomyces astaci]ETV64936.1 CAMK protein kinase [Aphanomyces astaci]|eukprot:XP_009845560.1 CAMK protein kinase [Aphanomyces astaci]